MYTPNATRQTSKMSTSCHGGPRKKSATSTSGKSAGVRYGETRMGCIAIEWRSREAGMADSRIRPCRREPILENNPWKAHPLDDEDVRNQRIVPTANDVQTRRPACQTLAAVAACCSGNLFHQAAGTDVDAGQAAGRADHRDSAPDDESDVFRWRCARRCTSCAPPFPLRLSANANHTVFW